MVKTLISMLCVATILFVGSALEMHFIHGEFEEFHQVISELHDKVDEQTAVIDDVYAVQDNWLNKKKFLHAFIPHNEIKEIDLWLAESATLVRDKEWKDAISKVEVLIELTEQIPKTFMLSWENIL